MKISNKILKNALDHFNDYKDQSYTVNPSLPILFFGDTEEYFKSEFKVITVGKNPSNVEFKLKKDDEYSYARFPDFKNDEPSLLDSLNNYFKVKPYSKWFNSFEPFLNGLDGSFYPNVHKNKVVSTDLCSPIPTDPTWTKLSDGDQKALFKEGFKLWKELVLELKPDLVVISVAKKYLSYLDLEKIDKPIYSLTNKLDGTPRSKPYDLELYELSIGDFKTNLVYGDAANTPFGTISNEEKEKMGRAVLNKLKPTKENDTSEDKEKDSEKKEGISIWYEESKKFIESFFDEDFMIEFNKKWERKNLEFLTLVMGDKNLKDFYESLKSIRNNYNEADSFSEKKREFNKYTSKHFDVLDPMMINSHAYDYYENGNIEEGLKLVYEAFMYLPIPNLVLPLKYKDHPHTEENYKYNASSMLDTLGYGFMLIEKYDFALKSFNLSIKNGPENKAISEHLANRGKAKMKLGDFDGAKKDFDLASRKADPPEDLEDLKRALASEMKKDLITDDYKRDNDILVEIQTEDNLDRIQEENEKLKRENEKNKDDLLKSYQEKVKSEKDNKVIIYIVIAIILICFLAVAFN